ncbi:MAG: hypothetical protein U0M06_12970 [Clostridia bacterium]|nr:hypothetical protein [Clostridia bacterium]
MSKMMRIAILTIDITEAEISAEQLITDGFLIFFTVRNVPSKTRLICMISRIKFMSAYETSPLLIGVLYNVVLITKGRIYLNIIIKGVEINMNILFLNS